MGLLDSIGQLIPFVGAGIEQANRLKLSKKVLKELTKKAQPLEIPQAYQDLSSSLLGQADTLGNAAKAQNTQDSQSALAKALTNLRQRGVASSNLTANLSAGANKQLDLANNSVDENILQQKLGLQQGIGTQGLATSAGQINQLTGIQGGMYNNLIPSTIGASPYTDMLKGLVSAGTKVATGGLTGGLA